MSSPTNKLSRRERRAQALSYLRSRHSDDWIRRHLKRFINENYTSLAQGKAEDYERLVTLRKRQDNRNVKARTTRLIRSGLPALRHVPAPETKSLAYAQTDFLEQTYRNTAQAITNEIKKFGEGKDVFVTAYFDIVTDSHYDEETGRMIQYTRPSKVHGTYHADMDQFIFRHKGVDAAFVMGKLTDIARLEDLGVPADHIGEGIQQFVPKILFDIVGTPESSEQSIYDPKDSNEPLAIKNIRFVVTTGRRDQVKKLKLYGNQSEDPKYVNDKWYASWSFSDTYVNVKGELVNVSQYTIREAKKGSLLTKIAPRDQVINHQNKGQCVINALCDKFNGNSRFVTYQGPLGRQKIISELGSVNPTLDQLERFCESHQIGLYVVGPGFKHLTKAKPQSEKKYRIMLYAMMNDEHLYVIDDPQLQHFIRKQWNGLVIAKPDITASNHELISWIPGKTKLMQSSKQVLLFDLECLSAVAADVITQTGHTITTMDVKQSKLVAFLHPVSGQWYLASPDYYNRKKICEIFKDKTNFLEFQFRNQSHTQLITDYLKAKIGFIEESKYTSGSLMEILTKQPLLPYIDIVRDVDLNLAEHNDTMSIDYYRCYSSILVNNEYNWPVFTQFDSIKPFDHKRFQKYKSAGLYMINKPFEMGRTKYMQNGSMYFEPGWYPAAVVDRCLEMNYIAADNIESQLLSSKKLNANFFRDFVLDVYKITNDHGMKDQAKVLINNMIGYLGKMYKKTTCASVTNSEPTAYAFQQWFGENKMSVTRMNDYYLMTMTEREHLFSGNLPIARQIVGSSYVLLDRLVHMTCGPESIPIAFNTDSFKVFKPLKIEFKSEPSFGDIRKEANVIIRQRQHKFKIMDPYPKFEIDISRGEIDYESPDTFPRLITGPAGSGKTELLKKIYLKNPDQTIVLTPTNVAAQNLEARGVPAMTIDKFFGKVAGVETTIDYHKLLKYKYVCIDEYSQLGYDWFHELAKAKWHVIQQGRRLDLTFHIFGDPNQCQPVQEQIYDVTGSDLMKFLTDSYHQELNYISECGRYTQETFDELQKLLQTGTWTKTKNHWPLNEAKFNITATRRKRREINMKYVEDYLAELGARGINSPVMIGSRNFALGMPIICYDNNEYSANAESFMITDFTDSHVILGPNTTLGSSRTVQVPKEMFLKKCPSKPLDYIFEYGFASTVNRVQGLTINGKYNIHEAFYNCLDLNSLYTSISRTKCLSFVAVDRVKAKYFPSKYSDLVHADVTQCISRGVIYKINSKDSNDLRNYIGLTKCKANESYQQSAERRLAEHIRNATDQGSENDKMKLFLSSCQTSVTVLHGVRFMTSRTLQKLETEEITRSCYEGGSSSNLNSQKHVDNIGQGDELKVPVIGNIIEAVTESIVQKTVQDKGIEWYITRDLIKDDRKVGRYRVKYYVDNKPKWKDYKYSKDRETAAKNAIEWYLKHNAK